MRRSTALVHDQTHFHTSHLVEGVGRDWASFLARFADTRRAVVALSRWDSLATIEERVARQLGTVTSELASAAASANATIVLVGVDYLRPQVRQALADAVRLIKDFDAGRIAYCGFAPLPGLAEVAEHLRLGDVPARRDDLPRDGLLQLLQAWGQPVDPTWIELVAPDFAGQISQLEEMGLVVRSGQIVALTRPLANEPDESTRRQLRRGIQRMATARDIPSIPGSATWATLVLECVASPTAAAAQVELAMRDGRIGMASGARLAGEETAACARLDFRRMIPGAGQKTVEADWYQLWQELHGAAEGPLARALDAQSVAECSLALRTLEVSATAASRSILRLAVAEFELKRGRIEVCIDYVARAMADLSVFENRPVAARLMLVEAKTLALQGEVEAAVERAQRAYNTICDFEDAHLLRFATDVMTRLHLYCGDVRAAAALGALPQVASQMKSVNPIHDVQTAERIVGQLETILTSDLDRISDVRPLDIERRRVLRAVSQQSSVVLAPEKCAWSRTVQLVSQIASAGDQNVALLVRHAETHGHEWAIDAVHQQPSNTMPTVDNASLGVDATTHRVLRNGLEVISLRRRIVLRKLLYVFCGHAGEVISKESLVRMVWEFDYHPLRHDATLFTNIMRLRRLLGDEHGDLIRSTEGGYVMYPPSDFCFQAA